MSRSTRIKGPRSLKGTIKVPGDKSISHRVAMLASIAAGDSTIKNFASSADCHSTLECLRRLGVPIQLSESDVMIRGRGLRGYQPPEEPAQLNVGNSGSTIRMLCGLLAGQGFSSVVDGDESIRRRPMNRIIEPLSLMGARIEAREGGLAPLQIHGSELLPVHYTSRVASAQVKTCVLFAGMYADGVTTFVEPARSRDHTELMLKVFGAHMETSGDGESSIEGGIELKPVEYQVPGDLSSAAFFLSAATLLRDSELVINDVSLNPTRTAFLDVMNRLGANIAIENLRTMHGEPRGDLRAASSSLEAERGGTRLGGDIIPNIIDEVPILAVAATQVAGRLEVRDARELRVKESDRLSTVAAGIRALGGRIEEFEDGFAIEGPQKLTGGRVETKGDHRIAMAFTIAGLIAEGETVIVDSDCAAVSFPEFYDLIAATSQEDTIEHE